MGGSNPKTTMPVTKPPRDVRLKLTLQDAIYIYAFRTTHDYLNTRVRNKFMHKLAQVMKCSCKTIRDIWNHRSWSHAISFWPELTINDSLHNWAAFSKRRALVRTEDVFVEPWD